MITEQDQPPEDSQAEGTRLPLLRIQRGGFFVLLSWVLVVSLFTDWIKGGRPPNLAKPHLLPWICSVSILLSLWITVRYYRAINSWRRASDKRPRP